MHSKTEKPTSIDTGNPISTTPVTYPLSTAQTEIWLAQQLHSDISVYNIAQYTVIKGLIDVVVFEATLRQVIGEADSLQLHFIKNDDRLQQHISSPAWSLSVVDFSAEADPQAAAQAWMHADDEQPVDILQGPLFHYALLKTASDQVLWYQRYHAIVMDGFGMHLLTQRVAHVYSAMCRGVEPDPCPFQSLSQLLGKNAQYCNSAQWARDEAYWLKRCAHWPEPVMLVTQSASAFSHYLRDTTDLAQPDSQRIDTFESSPIDLAHLVTAAMAAYLHRLTGVQDVVLGVPVSICSSTDQCVPGRVSNVLPVRLTVQPSASLSSLKDQVAQQIHQGLRHQRYPIDALRQALGLSPTQPLLSSILDLVLTDSTLSFDAYSSTSHLLATGSIESLVIVAQLQPDSRMLRVDLDANRAFDKANELTIRQHGFLAFLKALNADPTQPISDVGWLNAAQQQRLLVEWNATVQPVPDATLPELFEQQVERTPDATALVCVDQTLSYAELDAQANRLAHRLIRLGVVTETPVGVLMQRSPERVVAALAVIKAGGVYMPLNEQWPDSRLHTLLSETQAPVVLTDRALQARCDALSAHVIVVDADASLTQEPSDNLAVACSPEQLAYLMYTSGSTGQPKGVGIVHRTVRNTALDRRLSAVRDRVLLHSSHAFDVSMYELWTPLLSGGQVILVPPGELDVHVLQETIRAHQVSALWLSAGLFQVMAEGDLSYLRSVRQLTVGGDIVSSAAAQRLLEHCPALRFINGYGPTETNFATCHLIEAPYQVQASIPIGTPLDNVTAYVLDACLRSVPAGVVGELYIAGAGVARGYFNRPRLTAERFIAHPFDASGARLYRTGDLAYCRSDGALEFIGRADQQVKIRGFRVELGEIEAVLQSHPGVAQAAVMAREDQAGSQQLVGYIVLDEAPAERDLATEANQVEEWQKVYDTHYQNDADYPFGENFNTRKSNYDGQPIPLADIRQYVAARLPEYMVPAAFVRLNALPLTPNGKLDRRALPAPSSALSEQRYEAPQGELESTLAAIWRELLGVERIGRQDSFFALGGHSLLAVWMIERLRHVGLTVSVRTLFNSPTLATLAQSLGQHREVTVPPNVITPGTTAITPQMLPLIDLTQADIDRIVEQMPGGVANIQDIYALSPLQDGILFHHLFATDGDPYLLVFKKAFANRERLDSYLEAIQRVVDRHDILRTAFFWKDLSTPAQVVWRHAQLSITELVLDAIQSPVLEQLDQRFNSRVYRIDLTQAPLMHFVIAQDSDGRWILIELVHHLIADHSALERMHIEVQMFIEGRDKTLSSAQPFRNLVAQARLGLSEAEHARFFTDMLADVNEPTLPFNLSNVHCDGTQIAEAHWMLPDTLNKRLRTQAKRLRTSLASLCHLAWATVLARASGQQQVVFGTLLFGRMQAGDGAESAMGLFINTLPLRLDLNDNVEYSIRETHARVAALLEHEHASLALAQRCSGVSAGTPLFSALFNYVHDDIPLSDSPMADGFELLSVEERTNYPLTLVVQDSKQALSLTAQVMQPLDPNRVCGYMQQALASLVDALEYAPHKPIWQLEVLPEEERNLLLQTWNATQRDYPSHLCVHQLFESQVARTPKATALVFEEQSLSYAQLNAQANRLAHQLIKLGVKPDTRVAICVERSPALVVGLLAILKAGGAYVPLSPSHPGERLVQMLVDAAPSIVLANAEGRAALGDAALASRTVLDPAALPTLPDTNPLVPGLTARHLAYVIYTSGSTGAPKGVMVEHRSIARLVINNGYVDIGADDRVAFAANPAFDASTFEVWAPLLNGGCVVIFNSDTVLNPTRLEEALLRYQVTTLFLTTVLFNQLVSVMASALARLKYLLCGGEQENPASFVQLLKQTGPKHLIHCYGPTESTTFSTTYEVTKLGDRPERLPIGQPIANTQVYLLDAHGQPVPLGAVGQLYIGGAGVARGYLNRPELTAERFVPDPFSREADARMYKTGDLARYLHDGKLEFLGRNDEQVKIRGFRIEPGEIEACLAAHPQVHGVVVLALDEGHDKRLIAYVVAQADESLASTLRVHAAAALPEYMVPAAFVRLDALPLTPNGKLDRRALPAPDDDALAHQAYELPQGELETALAAIWAQLLGVERVGRHDSFFALGGHSLLAVRLMNRVRGLGADVPFTALFASPTLAGFASALEAHLQQGADTLPEITPASREGNLPLSFAQQRLWFLAQLKGVSSTYHIPLALCVRGSLDHVAWQQALDALFARHEALRSTFVSVEGQPQVQLLPADMGVPLHWHDLRGVPDADAQLARLSREAAHAPFDLARGPLLRACGMQLADDEHVVVLTQHHIVSDGWSLGVLVRDLSALYAASVGAQADPLPPLTVQYPDYAAWQRQWLSGQRLKAQRDYWRATLADAPVLLALPTDRPRPAQQSFAGAHVPVHIDAKTTRALKRFSREHGATLFMTVLAAWSAVLSRLSGQEDLVIGTPSANRNHRQIEPLIGFFVNMLASRVDLSGEPSAAQLLERVRRTMLDAQAYQDLPFEQVVQIVQPPRRLDYTPLFQVMFAWHNNEKEQWRLPGLTVTPAECDYDVAKFDLELNLYEAGEEIVGSFGYATALFDRATIDRHVGYLQKMLKAMADNMRQPVTRVELLTPVERTLLPNTRNTK
ncbi:amino acid adenylation domain-containing protein (plasmid) [Mycetohabitans endofungorum]|uniref:amino acid adenylation domain-containing protein n=1 Tax=Mycetohabitans endofungorum TaxID=417203 RepID=UPI0030D5987C